MPISLLHGLSSNVFHLLEIPTRCMEIQVSSKSALPSQQLIDRHICLLALDIPQGHVNAAHGIKEDRSIPPVRTDIRRLPYVFYLIRIPANEKRFQVLFDSRLHRVSPLGKGRAA